MRYFLSITFIFFKIQNYFLTPINFKGQGQLFQPENWNLELHGKSKINNKKDE